MADPQTYQFADRAPAPTRPSRRPRRWRVPFSVAMAVAAFALVGLVAWAAVTWAQGQPDDHTMRGQLVLTSDRLDFPDGTSCNGTGGFADMQPGAQVTVTDAGGQVIALGTLGRGHRGVTGTCIFPFEVTGIPPGHDFYGVEVGHRGVVRLSEAELAAVNLTLGG